MRKLVLLLLVLALPVWALPSPKEVSAAVNAGNFAHAEQLLQQIIKEKPNSALAHYELGQVLARENRHQEALAELNQAKALDASLHFAKDPAVFAQIYNAELATLQKPVALATHPAAQVSHPGAPRTGHSGSLAGFVLSILLLLAAALGGIYFWMKRADARRKQELQARQEEMSQTQLAQLLRMADAMRDADLECRAASYSAEQKQVIAAALATHRDALLRAIDRCKNDHMPLYDDELAVLQAENDRISQAVRSGALAAPAAGRVHEPVMPPPVQEGGMTTGYNNGQPIIINNNAPSSGSGIGSLMTGVVLGEILSGEHRSERVIYQERNDGAVSSAHEPPAFDGSNDNDADAWDDDSSSFGSNDFDNGNDDSWS